MEEDTITTVETPAVLATIPMHRPEDRVEHVVVDVPVGKVEEWKRAGWAVVEKDDE